MNQLTVKTTDTYETVFYLSDETTVIESVEVIPRGKQQVCCFSLSGDNLDGLQKAYLSREASINLYDLRLLFQQVNRLIAEARKKYREKQKNEKKEAVDEQ